jgi:hypothetical protein
MLLQQERKRQQQRRWSMNEFLQRKSNESDGWTSPSLDRQMICLWFFHLVWRSESGPINRLIRPDRVQDFMNKRWIEVSLTIWIGVGSWFSMLHTWPNLLEWMKTWRFCICKSHRWNGWRAELWDQSPTFFRSQSDQVGWWRAEQSGTE